MSDSFSAEGPGYELSMSKDPETGKYILNLTTSEMDEEQFALLADHIKAMTALKMTNPATMTIDGQVSVIEPFDQQVKKLDDDK